MDHTGHRRPVQGRGRDTGLVSDVVIVGAGLAGLACRAGSHPCRDRVHGARSVRRRRWPGTDRSRRRVPARPRVPDPAHCVSRDRSATGRRGLGRAAVRTGRQRPDRRLVPPRRGSAPPTDPHHLDDAGAGRVARRQAAPHASRPRRARTLRTGPAAPGRHDHRGAPRGRRLLGPHGRDVLAAPVLGHPARPGPGSLEPALRHDPPDARDGRNRRPPVRDGLDPGPAGGRPARGDDPTRRTRGCGRRAGSSARRRGARRGSGDRRRNGRADRAQPAG